MPLDVLELRRVAEGGVVPVEVAHPAVGVGVARADVADVALEVLDVDRLVRVSWVSLHNLLGETYVEADDGDEAGSRVLVR